MINDTRASPTASPCVGRCTLTTGDLVCKGCGRTEAEYRDWHGYSDEEKIQIKREAAQRLKMREHKFSSDLLRT